MVEIIRKGPLPQPDEVPESLREAAAEALRMKLREPRPVGFPLLFTSDMKLIEPAVAYLHQHANKNACTPDTLRTYMEILFDWFDALEQSGIPWTEVDAVDLVAYRNRMLEHPSPHTGRPYSVRTINHRIRGVLRFTAWAVRNKWLASSPLVGREDEFKLTRRPRADRHRYNGDTDRSFFVLRQFEDLPRPLTIPQARDLLAELPPPYDLIARWSLFTGLRISEVLRLSTKDALAHKSVHGSSAQPGFQVIHLLRKGRKSGSVIAPRTLLEETGAYVAQHRTAWLKRATRKGRPNTRSELFINSRGAPAKKNTYQKRVSQVGKACGFTATPHRLRSTFACGMLARLERLAKQGAEINPVLIVKVLLAHERIETTDKYLRAIAIDRHDLSAALEKLLDNPDSSV